MEERMSEQTLSDAIEQDGEEVPEELQEDEQQTEGEEEQQSLDPGLEKEARDMGWVPQDEYHGDPDNWRDADEFVKRGKEFLPIVQSRARKFENQLRETEARLKKVNADYEQRFAALDRTTKIALERQRKQIQEAANRDKRDAAALGDTDAYDAANEREQAALKELEQELSEAGETKQPERKAGEFTADESIAIAEWAVENDWFNTNKGLERYANTLFAILDPNRDINDRLEEIERQVREKFPDQVSKQSTRQGNGMNRVDSGGRAPAGGGGKTRMAAKLPPEAKEAAKEFIEQGLFKNIDEYAKEYFADEG